MLKKAGQSGNAPGTIDYDRRLFYDSSGKSFRLDDPMVTHIWPNSHGRWIMKMIGSIYDRRGLSSRMGGPIRTSDHLRGKQVCSGRECLAFHYIAGAIQHDIFQHRQPGEISLYHSLTSIGNCQVAAWPTIQALISARQNQFGLAFVGHPTLANRFIGMGEIFALDLLIAIIVGDLLEEAFEALLATAADRLGAQADFDQAVDGLLASSRRGNIPLYFGLRTWARRVATIARSKTIAEMAKILIFGGGAVGMLCRPILEYAHDRDVLAKQSFLSEFSIHMETEFCVGHAVRLGRPSERLFVYLPFLLSFFKKGIKMTDNITALLSRFHLTTFNLLSPILRKTAAPSMLIYDSFRRYQDQIDRGGRIIPYDLHHEDTQVLGKFITAIEDDVFDGFVHLSMPNCASIQVSSLLQTIARKYDVGYAGIEVDSPTLSQKQIRLLENVIVQARRKRGSRG